MNKQVKFLNGLRYQLKVSDDKTILVFRSEGDHIYEDNVTKIVYRLTFRIDLSDIPPDFKIANLKILSSHTDKTKEKLQGILMSEFPKWFEAWKNKYPLIFKVLEANRDKRSALVKLSKLKETIERLDTLLSVAKSEIQAIQELL